MPAIKNIDKFSSIIDTRISGFDIWLDKYDKITKQPWFNDSV